VVAPVLLIFAGVAALAGALLFAFAKQGAQQSLGGFLIAIAVVAAVAGGVWMALSGGSTSPGERCSTASGVCL
jgi:general stress protein CsbA